MWTPTLSWAEVPPSAPRPEAQPSNVLSVKKDTPPSAADPQAHVRPAGDLQPAAEPTPTPETPPAEQAPSDTARAGDQPADGAPDAGGPEGAPDPASPGGEIAHADVDPMQTILPPCPSNYLAESLKMGRRHVPGPGDGPVRNGPNLRASLQRSVKAAFSGEWASALVESQAAGYMLCHQQDMALWRPLEPGDGGARLVWRPEAVRPVVIHVPHPFFDRGTLPQGRHMFEALGARVLLISGHHRCTDGTPSRCDGETHVCSEDAQPYGRSDVAHNPKSLFHSLHEIVHGKYPEDVTLSLHVMGDTGFSVSNGTQAPVSTSALVARLVRALIRRAPHLHVTTCNPFPLAPLSPRLCGTTNAQGRHLNGSEDPCGAPAEVGSGLFLHIEQGGPARQEPGILLRALDEVLP